MGRFIDEIMILPPLLLMWVGKKDIEKIGMVQNPSKKAFFNILTFKIVLHVDNMDTSDFGFLLGPN